MDCSNLTVSNNDNKYINITYANGIDVYTIYISDLFIDDDVCEMIQKNQIEKLIQDYEERLEYLENDIQTWKRELKWLKEKCQK